MWPIFSICLTPFSDSISPTVCDLNRRKKKERREMEEGKNIHIHTQTYSQLIADDNVSHIPLILKKTTTNNVTSSRFSLFTILAPIPGVLFLRTRFVENASHKRPQRVMRKRPPWSTVSLVPSSLRSARLWLKQNYTFCLEVWNCHTSAAAPKHYCYCNIVELTMPLNP